MTFFQKGFLGRLFSNHRIIVWSLLFASGTGKITHCGNLVIWTNLLNTGLWFMFSPTSAIKKLKYCPQKNQIMK